LAASLDGRIGYSEERLVRAARRQVRIIGQGQSGSHALAKRVREQNDDPRTYEIGLSAGMDETRPSTLADGHGFISRHCASGGESDE
jgi:hypothetical protein